MENLPGEEWRKCEDKHYQISNYGRLRRLKKDGWKLRAVSGSHVPHYNFYRKGKSPKSIAVHVLVARAFLGAKEGDRIRKKDGDPLNCQSSNLEVIA